MLQALPVLLCCSVSLLVTPACTTPPLAAQRAVAAPGADLAPLVEAYGTDADALERFYDLPGAELRLARLDALDDAWRAKLDALDYDALSVEAAVDWHLLATHLAHERASRDRLRAQRERFAELLEFLAPIEALETARWELAPLDPRTSAQTVADVADSVEALKARVTLARAANAPPPDEAPDADAAPPIELDAADALRAARWVANARRTLDTWYRHYAAFRPDFAWWNEAPHARAGKALDALETELREGLAKQKGEDDDPLIGAPIGRDALLEDLAGEYLAYSPEELIAIGERELAWCEAELARAAAELGHPGDWKAALEEVKQAWVPPGEQDDLVAAQAREMIAWLDERDLVTIPALCRETWRVRMLDKRAQRTLPFAAYGGQEVLVAYPTDDMSQAEKLMSLRGNNRHFTRCVTPHELIPGHHLQGFMAQRHATHRGRFRTPFLVEGWALYWEMVEWDLGWPRSPEERLGMLFWRAHRAARILVSLRYHLGETTPEAMIDFLVERIGHERENATAEVRRYIGDAYSPLYQCGYMIGGLQLRALAHELVDSGRMSPREFHNAVLHQGPIPIELLRAALTGEKPARDAGPSWRF
ncbi:MAG: DUF885 family protein [Planctomycetes bacterium]|nr:DUF885 family protein [Planctomycetota bacterium]